MEEDSPYGLIDHGKHQEQRNDGRKHEDCKPFPSVARRHPPEALQGIVCRHLASDLIWPDHTHHDPNEHSNADDGKREDDARDLHGGAGDGGCNPQQEDEKPEGVEKHLGSLAKDFLSALVLEERAGKQEEGEANEDDEDGYEVCRRPQEESSKALCLARIASRSSNILGTTSLTLIPGEAVVRAVLTPLLLHTDSQPCPERQLGLPSPPEVVDPRPDERDGNADDACCHKHAREDVQEQDDIHGSKESQTNEGKVQ
mmetsp:Transcript_49993/g.156480  ORF Transcript_49993/g.156480 Transcript_49993/m.156480 type:complete len:257 (-) Transcript_49993:499-1269(-)